MTRLYLLLFEDLGSIRFSVIYNSASQQLKVNIISASNLPSRGEDDEDRVSVAGRNLSSGLVVSLISKGRRTKDERKELCKRI